ncbi:MAG: hypothetical protein CO120_01310 [Gammaproteobacteria bacterium CG_4_9_14_3_um_filter_38_9]|nr:MAG: hypothetical protein CO120_01310 [Gammaproteobacteria bacterium CG_4_9_14_3_um_filter_38_9]
MGTTLAACIAGWKIGIGPVAGAYGAGITTTFFGTTGLCFSGSTKSSAQPSEATSLLEPEDNGVDSQAHPAPKEMH